MRLWPWHWDDGIFNIILAFSALCITLSLSLLRIWSISRERMTRDLVFLGLHITSVLSVVGYVLLHAEYTQEDLWQCRMSNCFQYTGEYLRRMFELWIYWFRLNAFIGPVYPKWIRYPAILPMVAWVILLSLALNVEWSPNKGSFVDDEGFCLDERHISYHYVVNTVLVAVLFQGLPSFAYLILFIIPLLKYRDDMFITIARKHVLIATADILIDLIFLIVIISTHQSNASFWNASTILYIGLTVSNLLLIFVFADWRDYFCIRNTALIAEETKAITCSSLVTLGRLSTQSCSLHAPLLNETELQEK